MIAYSSTYAQALSLECDGAEGDGEERGPACLTELPDTQSEG